jgi:hypothetical protein
VINILYLFPGWQYRFFSVNAEAGMLNYFLCDDDTSSQPSLGSVPRGQYPLCAATTVNPSDEDSRTFTVNCASGEILKLRANDSNSRKQWVDHLREIIESHSQVDSPLPVNEYLEAVHYFSHSRQQLQQTELENAALARAIENAPQPLGHTDEDLLILKAISASVTTTLFQCLGLLQRHQEHLQQMT